jgi:trehalose 6-phosphate phosphatase
MMNPSVPLPTCESCLFLDVDGTLIELSEHPSQTAASRALKDLLMMVNDVLEGAVALISGRPIADLDEIFFPLRLRAAGVHGGERRDEADAATPQTMPDTRLDELRARMRDFALYHPGIVFEDKHIACAIHYRARPDAQSSLRQALAPPMGALGDDFHALEGNCVIEVKPRRFTKAHAIEEFLALPPFRHRRPVFLGDDVTDLDGFRVIEARRGMSVAVGNRVDAQWRLPDPAATRVWLGEFAAMCTP